MSKEMLQLIWLHFDVSAQIQVYSWQGHFLNLPSPISCFLNESQLHKLTYLQGSLIKQNKVKFEFSCDAKFQIDVSQWGALT